MTFDPVTLEGRATGGGGDGGGETTDPAARLHHATTTTVAAGGPAHWRVDTALPHSVICTLPSAA